MVDIWLARHVNVGRHWAISQRNCSRAIEMQGQLTLNIINRISCYQWRRCSLGVFGCLFGDEVWLGTNNGKEGTLEETSTSSRLPTSVDDTLHEFYI